MSLTLSASQNNAYTEIPKDKPSSFNTDMFLRYLSYALKVSVALSSHYNFSQTSYRGP